MEIEKKRVYLAAICLGGFDTIKAFCKEHRLNSSTITKLVNGNRNYIGDDYIKRFHDLIGDEISYVKNYRRGEQ
jgi:hypothetical protein